MRIFSAGLDCETNTFTNFPTTRRSFQQCGIWRGGAGDAGIWLSPVPKTFAKLASDNGFEYVEGVYAAAEPGGPVVNDAYEELREEILRDLEAHGPFDVVLLHLHGAMVADSCDDCAGDLLARARNQLHSDVVLGAVLDPHCHLTKTMVESADLLIACKHFPHDDYAQCAAELFRACVRTAQKQIRPIPGVFDCKMIGIYPTTEEPMAGIVRSLVSAEQLPGIVSATFVHGFPWGDTRDTGSKVLVYADADGERARACARELGERVYAVRELLLPRYPSVDEALDEARLVRGTVVLADTADNPGGGAPGDSVAVLAELLRKRIPDAALASIWDPQVAAMCSDAGVGTSMTLRLGGKTSSSSGLPIDVKANVRAVRPNHHQTSIGGTHQPMGLCVWLEIEGIDVVVSSVRSQVFAPDIFTGLGIALNRKRVVVVKSINHFVEHFAPIAARIVRMKTPGALTMDFGQIDYRKRSPDYHPRVLDPLREVLDARQ